jgi:hypothetical protein
MEVPKVKGVTFALGKRGNSFFAVAAFELICLDNVT